MYILELSKQLKAYAKGALSTLRGGYSLKCFFAALDLQTAFYQIYMYFGSTKKKWIFLAAILEKNVSNICARTLTYGTRSIYFQLLSLS